mmetsp:Transcript_17128/g.29915  ORF Transcript_17128/g.29915 Transcript_17128/m.29915 type:complete len:209 (-) Transcript_17128:339-965(-)
MIRVLAMLCMRVVIIRYHCGILFGTRRSSGCRGIRLIPSTLGRPMAIIALALIRIRNILSMNLDSLLRACLIQIRQPYAIALPEHLGGLRMVHDLDRFYQGHMIAMTMAIAITIPITMVVASTIVWVLLVLMRAVGLTRLIFFLIAPAQNHLLKPFVVQKMVAPIRQRLCYRVPQLLPKLHSRVFVFSCSSVYAIPTLFKPSSNSQSL